jgi:hypothetical protein
MDELIAFDKGRLFEVLGGLALPPWTGPDGKVVGVGWDCAPIAQEIIRKVEEIAIPDAGNDRSRADFYQNRCVELHSILMALTYLTEGKSGDILSVSDGGHPESPRRLVVRDSDDPTVWRLVEYGFDSDAARLFDFLSGSAEPADDACPNSLFGVPCRKQAGHPGRCANRDATWEIAAPVREPERWTP